MLVGLDVGYGQTKAVAENGKEVVFPSCIAQVDKTLVTNKSKVIEDKTGSYLVGNDALAMGKAKTPDVDSSWYRSLLYRLLVTKALKEIGETKVEVVTGLPLAHIEMHSASLTSEIKSWKTYGLKIDVLGVIPQPVGTLLHVAYGNDGQPDPSFNGRVGIVDIGRGTIDAVEVKNHQVNWSAFSSAPEGVSRVYVALQNDLLLTHSLQIDLAEIPETMEAGTVSKFGKKQINLGPMIKKAKKSTLAPLDRIVHELWGNQSTLSRLVFTGGGSALLKDDLKSIYHKDLICIPDRPDIANAHGYLNYAKHVINAAKA